MRAPVPSGQKESTSVESMAADLLRVVERVPLVGRLVREAALRIEGLLILAEHEFLSTVGAVERLIVECIHEP